MLFLKSKKQRNVGVFYCVMLNPLVKRKKNIDRENSHPSFHDLKHAKNAKNYSQIFSQNHKVSN